VPRGALEKLKEEKLYCTFISLCMRVCECVCVGWIHISSLVIADFVVATTAAVAKGHMPAPLSAPSSAFRAGHEEMFVIIVGT